MTYQQALAYLDSLINYEKRSGFNYKESFKLDRMESFSRLFGNPHKGIRTIHVGGTKGKGSVSSFINSILMEAGCKVGLYTSPHLFSVRERIRINGEAIKEKDVAALTEEIMPHIEKIKKKADKPTYFEALTMMAFLYFKREGAQFMILEVGMGGRLDSTNIAEPLISVITPVSHDHTRYLGNTLSDIAFEKCGIIKESSIVISSPQAKEAMDVIEQISKQKNSKLYVVGRDVKFQIIASDLQRQSFRLMAICGEYPQLEIKLLGDYQVENAATAVTAIEALRSRNVFINSAAIKNGLMKTRWPGRLQIIQTKPLTVVDGAQNVNSILALKRTLKNTFRYKKLFLVIGMMRDKDIDGICRQLCDIANYAVATKSKTERACPPETIKEKMLNCSSGIDTATADSVGEAIKKCREKAKEEDLILVTGSLYVVAEAMEGLHEAKI